METTFNAYQRRLCSIRVSSVADCLLGNRKWRSIDRLEIPGWSTARQGRETPKPRVSEGRNATGASPWERIALVDHCLLKWPVIESVNAFSV